MSILLRKLWEGIKALAKIPCLRHWRVAVLRLPSCNKRIFMCMGVFSSPWLIIRHVVGQKLGLPTDETLIFTTKKRIWQKSSYTPWLGKMQIWEEYFAAVPAVPNQEN
jgi:hypothetical protein